MPVKTEKSKLGISRKTSLYLNDYMRGLFNESVRQHTSFSKELEVKLHQRDRIIKESLPPFSLSSWNIIVQSLRKSLLPFEDVDTLPWYLGCKLQGENPEIVEQLSNLPFASLAAVWDVIHRYNIHIRDRRSSPSMDDLQTVLNEYNQD